MAIKTLPFLNKNFKRNIKSVSAKSNKVNNGGDPITPEKIKQYKKYTAESLVLDGAKDNKEDRGEGLTIELQGGVGNSNEYFISNTELYSLYSKHSAGGKSGEELSQSVIKDVYYKIKNENDLSFVEYSEFTGETVSALSNKQLSNLKGSAFNETRSDFDLMGLLTAEVQWHESSLKEWASNSNVETINRTSNPNNDPTDIETELAYKLLSGTATNNQLSESNTSIVYSDDKNKNYTVNGRFYMHGDGYAVFQKQDDINNGVKQLYYGYLDDQGNIGSVKPLNNNYLNANTELSKKGDLTIKGNFSVENRKRTSVSLRDFSSIYSKDRINDKDRPYEVNSTGQKIGVDLTPVFQAAYNPKGSTVEKRIEKFNENIGTRSDKTFKIEKTLNDANAKSTVSNAMTVDTGNDKDAFFESVTKSNELLHSSATLAFASNYKAKNGKEFNGNAVIFERQNGPYYSYSTGKINVPNVYKVEFDNGKIVKREVIDFNVDDFQTAINKQNKERVEARETTILQPTDEDVLDALESTQPDVLLGHKVYFLNDGNVNDNSSGQQIQSSNENVNFNRTFREEERDYIARAMTSSSSSGNIGDGYILEQLKQNKEFAAASGFKTFDKDGTISQNVKTDLDFYSKPVYGMSYPTRVKMDNSSVNFVDLIDNLEANFEDFSVEKQMQSDPISSEVMSRKATWNERIKSGELKEVFKEDGSVVSGVKDYTVFKVKNDLIKENPDDVKLKKALNKKPDEKLVPYKSEPLTENELSYLTARTGASIPPADKKAAEEKLKAFALANNIPYPKDPFADGREEPVKPPAPKKRNKLPLPSVKQDIGTTPQTANKPAETTPVPVPQQQPINNTTSVAPAKAEQKPLPTVQSITPAKETKPTATPASKPVATTTPAPAKTTQPTATNANKPLVSTKPQSTPVKGSKINITRDVRKDDFISVDGKMTSTGMVKTVVDGKVYTHPTVFLNEETGELYELNQEEAFEKAQSENELIELGEDNKENNLQANLIVKDTGVQTIYDYNSYSFNKKNDDNSISYGQGMNVNEPLHFTTISADGTEKENSYYNEMYKQERIVRYLYDENGQYLGRENYNNSYDENGKLKTQEHYTRFNKHEDKDFVVATTVFDENGNVVEVYKKDVLTGEKTILDEDPNAKLDPKGGTKEAPPVSETVSKTKVTPFDRNGVDNVPESTTPSKPQNVEQPTMPVTPAATKPAATTNPLPDVNQTPSATTTPETNTTPATTPVANVEQTPTTPVASTTPAVENTPTANKPLPSTTPQQEPASEGITFNELAQRNTDPKSMIKNHVSIDGGITLNRTHKVTEDLSIGYTDDESIGLVKTVRDGKVYVHPTIFKDGRELKTLSEEEAFEYAKENGELFEIGEDNVKNNAAGSSIVNAFTKDESSYDEFYIAKDENGNVVIEKKYASTSNGKPTSISTYDINNNIESDVLLSGGVETRSSIEYNDDGIYEEGMLYQYVDNEYDKNGNLVKQNNLYRYNDVAEEIVINYDKNGNVENRKVYDYNGNEKESSALNDLNQLQGKTPKLNLPKPDFTLNRQTGVTTNTEQPSLPKPNIPQDVETAGTVQPINNEPAQPLPAPETTTATIPAPPKREGVRLNYDADGNVIGESTHKMATETFDGENWFSFPTLFQNEDGTWVDMSDRPWKEAYDEAQKRGEVIDFGTDKEGALAYGEGSWKENYNQQNGIPTPDKNTPAPLPTPLESGTKNNLNYVQNRIDNQVPEYISRGTTKGIGQPSNVEISNIDIFEGYGKKKKQNEIVEQQIAENVSNVLQRVDLNNPLGKNLNPLPSVLDRGPDWAEFRRMNDIVRNGTPYDFNRSEFFTPNLDFNPPTINPDEGYIIGVPERLRPIVPPHVSGFKRPSPSIKLPTDPIGVAESGVDENGNSIIERSIYGPNVTNFKRPTINAVDETSTVETPVNETTPVTNETNTEVTTPIEGESSTPDAPATTEANTEAAKSNAPINRNETNFSMGGKIYDMATSINMLRAASNYTQPPPPMLQTERMNPSRIRVDRSPYEMASQQMTAQGNQVMNSLQDNTGSASTLLAGAAQVGANMANAQNQINAQYSQTAQGVMAQNAQMQQQANQFNAQMGTQNNQVNAQLQLQAAQGKQTAIDNNVNAALAAQAQKENYLNQKEYVYKQSEIQRRAMQYQLDMQSYNQRLIDPNLNMEYQSQVDAFNEGFNKIYGPGTEKYIARMAEMEKQYEDPSQYGTLLPQYNTLLESYGGDETKIAELNKQTKNLLVQQAMTKDYIGPTLSEYKASQGFDEKQLYQNVYGAMPELNFDDLIMYQ